MKDIASVDFVLNEMDIYEDDGLCQSSSSLKMVVDPTEMDESNVNFIAHRASSNSNLQNITDNDSTITHARSENMIPNLIKKKNRLISTDSGFGSYGPCELYNSSSVDSMANIVRMPKCTSIQTKAILNEIAYEDSSTPSDATNLDSLEKDDKVSPLISEIPAAESTPKIKPNPVKHSKTQRNTTVNSIDDNFVLDPKLINRDDGFHEVQCYINEHGSPVVQEKRRANRKKSTLREELKARSLGASYDDNLLRKDTNKTPTCVSFSRLFKKLRETFCK